MYHNMAVMKRLRNRQNGNSTSSHPANMHLDKLILVLGSLLFKYFLWMTDGQHVCSVVAAMSIVEHHR